MSVMNSNDARNSVASLRVLLVLVGDVVVFVSWLVDNLAVMEGTSGKDSVDPTCFVVYNNVSISIFVGAIFLTPVPRTAI